MTDFLKASFLIFNVEQLTLQQYGVLIINSYTRSIIHVFHWSGLHDCIAYCLNETKPLQIMRMDENECHLNNTVFFNS